MGVEGGKVIVLARDSGASGRAGMENFSIDPFSGVHASLDHGYLSVKGVPDVGASLGVAPLVKVEDGVVVGVGDVVLCPLTLDNAAGVALLIIAF